MISFYHDTDGRIRLTDAPSAEAWVHVEEPTDAEIDWLAEEIGIPRVFLNAAMDPHEVARVASRQDAHAVIVHAPYDFGAADRIPYRTVPLAMIAAPDHFVTVCRKPLDLARELNFSFQNAELPTRRAGRMIPAILGVVAEKYLSCLEVIDRQVEDIADRLMDSIENSEMIELLRYEKSLVHLKTGLEWNERMIEHVEGNKNFDWDEADQSLFADVRIEYEQGLQVATTMLEMLTATTDAFASLISNNLNSVMKLLAAVTIVLTVPMIIFSIYGMNVALPGDSHPYIFVLLILLSLALTLVVALWFQRLGWLSFYGRKRD